jgi:hypothetical protein
LLEFVLFRDVLDHVVHSSRTDDAIAAPAYAEPFRRSEARRFNELRAFSGKQRAILCQFGEPGILPGGRERKKLRGCIGSVAAHAPVRLF